MSADYPVARSVISLVEGDITAQDTDAIVNAANGLLLGGGGVDGAIHDAAGPELLEACRAVKTGLPGGRLATGGAVITPGFALRARHVVHCVGPVYAHAGDDAPRLLASCYTEALALCRAHGLRTVAFPSISTGAYGYPTRLAAGVALTAVSDALALPGSPVLVRVVLYDAVALRLWREAAEALFGH